MKAFLMYQDRDFDPQEKLPPNEQAVAQDLELNVLFNAMARGDKFLFDVGRSAIFFSLKDLDEIRYRQHALKDCLKNPAIVRNMYDIAVEAIEGKKRGSWGFYSRYPSGILMGSIEALQIFVDLLGRLRGLADEHADKFESQAFATLFAMLKKELSDDYFIVIQDHLKRLKFRDGVLLSAELGKGNKGANYVLRRPHDRHQSWIARIFARRPPAYTYRLHPRDEAGARALSELRDRGINLVANALAQSAEHIRSFFSMLRTELAFYVGCLNLHAHLARKGEPTCFPEPVGAHERRHSFRGLYDVALTLSLDRRVVGNDVNGDDKDLVVITGANQGGKSTFLRGIGLAQLMMQCGMFVPAGSFCANVCDGLFTHYKREEDTTMKSGKLDEELKRMSEIADNVTPNSLLLFNESFAATNEREGSEIARQIVGALLEKRIKIFFVTHLYELAHGLYDGKMKNAAFLRAERKADGGRTFKLIEGEPLETSYGEDLYRRIFSAPELAIER